MEFDDAARARLASFDGRDVTIGFRPEAVRVGAGPLKASIRTVEDLGSEVFVHVTVEHRGEATGLVAKMAPPFRGAPGEAVGLQITGTVHLFGGDGLHVTSTEGTLRSWAGVPS